MAGKDKMKISKSAKRTAAIGAVKNIAGKAKGFLGHALSKAADKSGFGNPLSASKQYADDMVEDAIKKAEKELEELSLSPSNIKSGSKITVKRVPSGYKAGSHHPPAKSTPRFKASVKF